MTPLRVLRSLAATAAILACGPFASADEGMWTFHDLPLALLKERYGFTPAPQWIERVRLASVRFNDGGSGSFVSPDGLMITNHHVGLGCIQNVSTAAEDLVNRGFVAGARANERACPGYEVNVLVETRDVTAAMKAGLGAGLTDRQTADTLRANTARLQNECAAKSGLRCDVVKLYGGAEYQLYTYRKHTDVRLVMAPEQQIAFFGGDPDNFTYPRYNLDVSFFRAYEGGQPVRPAAWLRWSTRGAKDGDLVFVSGNPGSTRRLLTVAELAAERDVVQPEALVSLERRRKLLAGFAAKSPENARRVAATMHGVENSIKGRTGRVEALRDVAAMARLEQAEAGLRAAIRGDPDVARQVGSAFEELAATRKRMDALVPEKRAVAFGPSRLLTLAGQIVWHAAETRKPNEQRFEEYTDGSLGSLENKMFSPAPIFADVEELQLADQLAVARETLGDDHPFVKAALGGRTPQEVAREALAGTKLYDVAARKALVTGGPAAVAASTDPMIALARRIDPLVRAVRQQEEDLEAAQGRASERLAAARFALHGRTVAPDATFTPRLSIGTVKGYPYGGTMVPAFTTFYGLFDRAAGFGNAAPWNLPPRWAAAERREALHMAAPFNFVSTNDIIGGNSGSPVIDRAGEFVGIVFDGNIEGLAWDYYYDDRVARSVAVDARGIVEALRSVYAAEAVVAELLAAR